MGYHRNRCTTRVGAFPTVTGIGRRPRGRDVDGHRLPRARDLLGVSEETRTRHGDRPPAGLRPPGAAAPGQRQTRTVAVVAKGVTRCFAAVVEGAEEVLRERGYDPLLGQPRR